VAEGLPKRDVDAVDRYLDGNTVQLVHEFNLRGLFALWMYFAKNISIVRLRIPATSIYRPGLYSAHQLLPMR
jgi:hypothetical protein